LPYVRFFLALVAAAAVDSLVGRIPAGGTPLVDPWLVLVLVVGSRRRAPTGTVGGAAAGLCQDVLYGALLGLHGLSKTLVGFLCHLLSERFLLARTLPRLGLVVMATLVDRWALAILLMLLGRGFAAPGLAVIWLALGNAAAFLLLSAVLDRLRYASPELEPA
jgi:rod shape-determining protein MreD